MIRPISFLPKSHVPVVVCRSAGIRTRGRLTALKKDRQPEANRRTSPNEGRDLKQRRTGLFWSLSAPPKAGLPKRLVSLAGRADGNLSLPIDGYGTKVGRKASSSAMYPTAQHLTGRLTLRGPEGPSEEQTVADGGSTPAHRVSIARRRIASPPILWLRFARRNAARRGMPL
jgi:hypothetical protein